jgi:membrane associated rhomboid family serine protease
MMNYTYNQPHNPLDELKKFFRSGSALSMLIIINAVVWGIIQVMKVFFFFLGDREGEVLSTLVLHTLAIPAYIPDLLAKPWSVVTYCFLHIDVLHILFNMVTLYWFGKIFLEFLNTRKLVIVYLLGGISGGLVYVFAFNVFPVFEKVVPISYALGASASVMAIVAAISFHVPNYSINLLLLGRIRIGYLALILFISDFFMIPSGNSGGHIAHIGGAIFGVLYVYLNRFSKPVSRSTSGHSFWSSLEGWFRKKKQEPGFSSAYRGRPMTDDEYNLKKKENQKRIDEILEKISRGGYDSLTLEEKEFLFKTSNKH